MSEKEKPVFTSSKAECGICLEEVNAIDLEAINIPSVGNFWGCDQCRLDVKNGNSSAQKLNTKD